MSNVLDANTSSLSRLAPSVMTDMSMSVKQEEDESRASLSISLNGDGTSKTHPTNGHSHTPADSMTNPALGTFLVPPWYLDLWLLADS